MQVNLPISNKESIKFNRSLDLMNLANIQSSNLIQNQIIKEPKIRMSKFTKIKIY